MSSVRYGRGFIPWALAIAGVLALAQGTPPTLAFSSSAAAVAQGKTVTLRWSAPWASTCTASGGWSGPLANSGSKSSGALTVRSTEFTLTCEGQGNTVTRKVSVEALPVPSVTLATNKTALNPGGSIELTWQSDDATACTASGGWSGAKALDGREVIEGIAKGNRTYTLSCRGVGGTTRKSVTVAVSPEPTVTLSASPSSVLAGKTVSLRWSSKDATACVASGDWAGAREKSGSAVVGPLTDAAYNYALKCTGPGGTGAASTIVQVVPPPTVALYLNSEVVAPGASVTLDWSSTDATSCRASGPGWSGTKPSSGREVLTGLTRGKKAYSITCTGGGGSAKDARSLDVVAPPSLTFAASASDVATGKTVSLRWSSKDATSCFASGDWTGQRAPSGSVTTDPLTKADNFFTLTCNGSNGSDTETVRVRVRAAPTVTLSASAEIVEPKKSVTLTWISTDAQSCRATGGWSGEKAAQGTETLNDLTVGRKSYLLTCTGAGGKQSAERVVTVAFKPTVTLSASPSTINVGESTALEWTTTDARSCEASGDWSGNKDVGSRKQQTVPSLTKRINTFNLTCRGDGGEATASQDVVARNAPTLTFSALSALLTPGQRAQLTWSSTGATRCVASDRWSGDRDLKGSFTSEALPVGSFTYRLACDNGAGGSDVKSVTIDVVEPVIKASPTSLAFSTVAVGSSSAARTVTLTNSSRVALPISELKIAGTHSVDYAQTNDCGDALAAAASCRVAVIFKPTATGSRIAEVSLSSSAFTKPLTVMLTGAASGNSVAVSRIQSIDVSGANAFILAQDSRAGALARAARRGLRVNVGPLDEIAIESPRLYKVEGEEEPVEIEFKDNEGKVITQDEVTVVGIIDLESYVVTKLKDSNGVVDFLVDKTTGAAYKSTGLEWSDPKVLANGDIVARRGNEVFFVDVSNLGSGTLRAEFLPSIDVIKEFEVSDTDGFLVYSGTNKNSGRSACRIVDLRKKDGEAGRLRDAADFVPEGATSRWDNCLWFWHPTERAIYFADYQDYVAGLRRESIDYIRVQRNSAGELVKGQRLNFSCVAPNRGEFAQPRLAYFSMCTHSIGRGSYLRSRGQWVAGRYVFGQEYMWPTVVDVEGRKINHLDTLNEAVCSNCGNDDTWWYKTFASDNYVWMFGLDRNTSRDIVGQLDLDTGLTRSIRINEVDVAEIFPLSDGKILFKGDRLSDVSKVVGTLSVNGDVFVNEVYPYITAAGAEIVAVDPDSSYQLLRYKVNVVSGEGGTVSPASADVLIDRTASFVLTPAAGFEVDSAVGCGGKRSGNSYTTGKITAACDITVSFKKRDSSNDNSADLTVIKTGTGSVKSTPAGIDCGTTCAVAFEKNKAVTLVATPAAGQTFSGWGGACSGAARSCTVNMTDATGVTATFTAAGTGPRLVLGAGSVAFGAVSVGSRSSGKDVTLTNEGSASLSLSGLTLGGAAADQFTQANDCGNAVAVGANCTLTFVFAPSSEGVKRAELTISSNAGTTQTVTLEGTGAPAPQVAFDSPSVAFGDVDIGQSADRTVTITNAGGAELVITTVGVSGNNADQFARTTTCLDGGGKLAPGARCTVAIKFKPGTAGAKSSLLVVDSNAPSSPATLALRGNAAGPRVSIEASPKVVTPGGKARLTWSSNVMTRCSASGAWSGTRELSGSIETPVLSESARFVLTCEGPLGSRTDETEVLVSSNLATAVSLSVKGAPVAGTITTVAGIGPSRFNGDGIAASGAGLNRPHAIATDNLGNLFIADSDNHRIRRVDAVTGVIATVAGFGEGGYTGDGAAATEALLNSPHGVAVDSNGTLYIADTGNHRIRRVTPAGVITTIAGTGQAGYSGDGGAATRAQFNSPSDVVIDGPGALIVVDRMNHRVRRIDLTTGVIATIAGTGEAGFSGDGGPATLARLNQPWHAVIDRAGDVLIADKDNQRVRKITRSSGVITTVAGDGSRGGEPTKSIAEPAGLAVTADGSVYVADGAWCFVRKLVPGSTNMEVVAGCDYNVFGSVYGMAVDRSGGLLLAELVNSRIRRLDLASKLVTTVAGDRARDFAGDGDAATLASLRMPHGLARDSRGNLYVADWENRRVRRIDAVTNVITTVLGDLWALGLATDSADNVYVADHYGNRIWRVDARDGSSRVIAGIGEEGFSGDGGPATAARLRRPYAIVIDSNGNVIFTEQESRRIRKINSSGTISTIAGDGEWGFSGDGGPAALARLSFVRGLALDADGNLYLADRGNNRIRRIDTTGVISTVAGNGTFSSAGDNGPAVRASLRGPDSVTNDAAGNLFIVEADGDRIRRIDRALGTITTVAGTGRRGYRGEGGPALEAWIDQPNGGVLIDPLGNLYFSDTHNNRVRRVQCVAVVAPGWESDCRVSQTPAEGGVYSGSRVWVTWSAPGAQACTASGGWSGTKAASGSEWVGPLVAGDVELKLTCRTTGGETGATTTALKVISNPLRISFSASPASVVFGGKSRLTWSAVNATSCVARGAWSGTKSVSGTEETAALQSDEINEFILTCSGATGSVTERVQVRVADELPSASVSADRTRIRPGESVTLKWSSARATSCRAETAWTGALSTSGERSSGALSETATFAVSCAGPTGIARDSVTVLVSSATEDSSATVTFTARRPVAGTISTFAGVGPSRFSGDGGRATRAELGDPTGIARDSQGNMYFADCSTHRIRRISKDGTISTIAGIGEGGYSGDNGQASEARIVGCGNIDIDSRDVLYFPDVWGNRIRAIDLGTGRMSTIAGTGERGFDGDGSLARNAKMNEPAAVKADGRGSLYIADFGNHRVRKIDLASGLISTIAGTGDRAFSGDGGPAISATLQHPANLDFDAAGNLFIADSHNDRVRRVDANGNITTVAHDPSGSIRYLGGLAVSPVGEVYVTSIHWCVGIRRAAPGSTELRPVLSCDHSGQRVGRLGDLAFDGAGGLWLADRDFRRISRVSLSSSVLENTLVTVAGSTPPGFSGDGGPAYAAGFYEPWSVARDLRGNLYIGDTPRNQRIRRIDAQSSVIQTLATDMRAAGLTVSVAGVLYATDYWNHKVWAIDLNTGTRRIVAGTGEQGFAGDGGDATRARLNYPYDMAVDAEGNLFISDQENARVRRVDAKTGVITTVLGNGGCASTGDSGLAVNAAICRPRGLHVDRLGRLLIVDRDNHRVRRIERDGTINTVAGTGGYDSSGDGGLARSAMLKAPMSVTSDDVGNLFITEIDGNKVRRVDGVTGRISTIAGSGARGFAGDGGPATAATFDNLQGVTRDPAGNLYLIDSMNNRVRVVHCATAADAGTVSDCDASRPVVAGDRVQLVWSSSGTEPCTASGAWSGMKRANGAEWVTVPSAGVEAFSLSCGTDSSVATRQAAVTVVAAPPRSPAVKLDVSATLVAEGERVRLQWSSADAVSCSASGSWSGPKILGGSEESAALTAGVRKFTLTCVGPTGRETLREVTVEAVNSAPTISFTADPPRLPLGTTTRLVWSSGKATACVASGGWSGSRPTSGEFVTPPLLTDTRYTLTCTGPRGSRSADIDVTLSTKVPRAASFEVKASPVAGTISTIAGVGPSRYNGDDIPAVGAALNTPMAVAVDSAGNLFIADSQNHRIRRVDAASGRITTVAGTGERGYAGDGAAATEALLSYPLGVAVDGSGNLFIADTQNARIRRVSTSGVITTIAGTGQWGYSGDGGPASSAQFNQPADVAVDGPAALLISDQHNHRIRRIDLATGVVTTVVGNGEAGFSGDGGVATLARLNLPLRVLRDSVGDLVVTDYGNQRVRKVVRTTGVITTVGGDGSRAGDPTKSFAEPGGLVIAADGSVYVADASWCWIRRLTPGSITMELIAGCDGQAFGGVNGMALDRNGGLLIGDTWNGRVRRLDLATKAITTVVGDRAPAFGGDDGPATAAGLRRPHSIVQDASGHVYFSDRGNGAIRRIDANTGVISSIWRGGCPGAIAIDSRQQLFAADSCEGNRVIRIDLATGESSLIKGFNNSGGGIAVDSRGNIFVSEHNRHVVRRIDAETGAITTYAGDGRDASTGDGGPAATASVRWPMGLAVDADDNLYIAARNNQSVRRVDARTGIITTIVGGDRYGYAGDGGPATSAALRHPHGLAFDASGTLLVADFAVHVVRAVDAVSGRISTVAGNGFSGFFGDGGVATQARLDEPEGMLVDRTGNVLIADSANNRIRMVRCAATPQAGWVSECVAPANPLYAGQRVWVSWNVLGATSCNASGGWSGTKDAAGGEWVLVKSTGTQDFKLDCTGPGGTTSGISTRANVVTNPLTVSLTSSATTVKFGEKVRLNWSSTNATSCVARGAWGGAKATNGQEESVALDARSNNEFVLTCIGATGSVSKSVSVAVVDARPTVSLTASATSVRPGETVRLDWTSQRTGRCVASGDWTGSRATSGSQTTTALTAASARFVLTCDGAVGTARDEVTVVTSAAGSTAGPQISLNVRRPVAETISTFAGQGPEAYGGEPVTAVRAGIRGPHGLARDAVGNLYIAEARNHVIRRLDAATGVISTFVGRGIQGGDGDGGRAIEARLNYPTNLAFDAAGNLYIADQGNHRIRVVDRATGLIRTVAGTGQSAFSGDGGLATLAALNSPTDLAFDSAGNLFITDWGNARIRRIDASTRVITTVGGTGNTNSTGDGGNPLQADMHPYGLAIDSRGDLIFSEVTQDRIRKIDRSNNAVRTIAGTGANGYSGDGGPGTAAQLRSPHGVSVDAAGNVYIADASNYRIRKLDAAGVISTVAGAGNVYGDDMVAAENRLDGRPLDVITDPTGLVFTDFDGDRVRRIDAATGLITSVIRGAAAGLAGDGDAAISAALNAPTRVALDSRGNIYIGDYDNGRIRRIALETGVVTSLVSSVLPGVRLGPGGLAFDQRDNLYFSDRPSNRVWRRDATDGRITPVAGNGSRGFGGDGGAATAAILNEPGALRFDKDGNLLIAEPDNLRVRRVNLTTGIITTIAGTGECCGEADDGRPATTSRLAYPSGIAVDRDRGVLIADRSHRIRKVDTAGVITTIAGNRSSGYAGENVLAATASLNIPGSLALDSAGNIFFTDVDDYRVRKIDRSTGRLSTVAGDGERGFRGDGGPATGARFDNLNWDDVAVDQRGNLLITDTRNNRVRVVHCAAAPDAGNSDECSSAAALRAGDRVQVTWNATGATSCVASGAWRGEKAVSGGEWLWLGAGARRYSLTCTGPGGVSVKDVDLTAALISAVDAGVAAVKSTADALLDGLARSNTIDISLSGLPSAAGSASSAAAGRIASISQAPSGNARYVLVADSSSTSTQRGWRLQHQSLQGSVYAERNLPTTSDVLWRRASGTGVPLPTSAWVRQCGATVYTVQDGYRVQVTAWDPQLIDGWQSEINLGEPARVTVLTMVECDGAGLRIGGVSLGINHREPAITTAIAAAERFSGTVERGRESPRRMDRMEGPLSISALCASSADELRGFCRAYRDATGP